jgi:hypothetical protein
MDLHFVTSLSKEYWENTAKYCIPSWNLPGRITVFFEQSAGRVDWINEIPFDVQILIPPSLTFSNSITERAKVQKFWGKSYTQIHAVKNRKENERIIWIDSDVEQTSEVTADIFNFKFLEPIAILDSQDDRDRWETGLVIFNDEHEKLNLIMKKYEQFWNDSDKLSSLWKPYDAQVLGEIALERGYYNLCQRPCKNLDALNNSIYSNYFIHWINKQNKENLKKLNEQINNSDIS